MRDRLRVWMLALALGVAAPALASTGKAPNADRMSQQFSRRPDTIYVRTPSTIDVFSECAVASE